MRAAERATITSHGAAYLLLVRLFALLGLYFDGRFAQCPAHPDLSPSLSVGTRRDDDGVLLYCHAGCSLMDIVRAFADGLWGFRTRHLRNGPAAELIEFHERRGWPEERPARGVRWKAGSGGGGRRGGLRREWVYRAEDRSPLIQVTRSDHGRPPFEDKSFFQCRWEQSEDGFVGMFFDQESGQIGMWRGGTEGVRRTLLYLPAVIAAVAEGRLLYIVEGEKCADLVIGTGAMATTNPGGSDGWPADDRHGFAAHLAGADVVVCRDRDLPGIKWGEAVCSSLRRVGVGRLRVMEAVAEPNPITGVPTLHDVGDHVERGLPLSALVLVEEVRP